MKHKPIELVIQGATWEQTLRPLLLEPGQIAVGSMRLNDQPICTEFLVDRLEMVSEIPSGEHRPPLTDWLVLTVNNASSLRSAREILAQIQPRQSQAVAVLVLSTGDRGRWEGLLAYEGNVSPLAGVRIIGPGMLQLNASTYSEPLLDPATLERASRTIGALGETLWRRGRDAHVLLLGCGRTGTLAAWQLIGLGVNRMTLVDPDLLELGNLDGMPGFTPADVGRAKVEALAERLVTSQPELSLKCLQSPAQEVLGRLRVRPDLIVTCVDDDVARLAASRLSRELLAPHLDIATSVQTQGENRTLTADIRLLLPFQGCVDCVGGLADREAALYAFAAPPGSLFRGEPTVWNRQRAGSLVHLNSLAVGVGLQLWLSLLKGDCGSFWQRLALDTAGGLIADGASMGAGENCLYCALGKRHNVSLRI